MASRIQRVDVVTEIIPRIVLEICGKVHKVLVEKFFNTHKGFRLRCMVQDYLIE